MIDFLMISTRSTKRGVIEIYPKFIIKKSSDLMIRGGDFYAIWLEDRGLWSTDKNCINDQAFSQFCFSFSFTHGYECYEVDFFLCKRIVRLILHFRC